MTSGVYERRPIKPEVKTAIMELLKAGVTAPKAIETASKTFPVKDLPRRTTINKWKKELGYIKPAMTGESLKFFNNSVKKDVILSVFGEGETLKGEEITKRISELGYRVKESNVKMFIYYHMQYQYLKKERIKGVNYYSKIGV